MSNVSIFSIMYSIFKFSGKFLVYKLFICLELIPILGRIRIGMPWMPIPIRIRQNYVDPTRPVYGSTTLTSAIARTPHHILRCCMQQCYPCVFGPPGSGFVSTRYGSGSFYH